MAEQIANAVVTTLNGAITAGAASLVVTSATGLPSSGDFRLRIDDEILICTARSSTTCTVTRGAESTTAAAHSNGATVSMVLTAEGLTTAIEEAVAAGTLADDSVTNAKLAEMADATVKGRASGAGTGNPTDLSAAQVTAIVASGSGGGTSNFLRADGTWAAPSGSGATFPWASPTAPVNGDFAWINQGSATVSANASGIGLVIPASSALSLRIRKKAAPSTPYTITAGFMVMVRNSSLHTAGLCFRQSSDGKIATLAIIGGTSWGLYSQKLNSPTSFSADYASRTFWPLYPIWLRIADDGSNRICSYSCNGYDFEQLHSVGRTDFLTADEVGFFGNDETNTGNVVQLFSWAEA
jgi:hypothetical protein